jgi:Ni/Fe-hydrogenase 1 B-type cytochrome subunit
MKMEKITVKRVYVWQTPVRFYHWLNAISVVVLCITGYIIGSPPALQNSSEASFGYWFGTVRFLHFIFAFLFFFNFLFRIYWGFVGNKYSDWRNFILINKKQWQEIKDVLKIDVFHREGKPIGSIGHNALAGLTYFLSFLAFLFQCITGFGLYAAMSDSFLPHLFSWIVPLMGGDFAVRQWHHAFMWFFVIFSVLHVYIVFYHDYIEGRGVLSSMAGGWKFIEKKDT